jgi:hypothetical protein
LSIEEKIQKANMLYAVSGEVLRQDGSIRALLERLQRSIQATRETMSVLGVVAECKHCEEEEGGSCCGAGIENRYDVVLLLVNLLLHVALPTQAQSRASCYFLGENGCTLLARHVLCVNYLCAKIQNKLSRHGLGRLQDCINEELDAEFFLHEAIKRKLGVTGNG